jgi:hypothetical protein
MWFLLVNRMSSRPGLLWSTLNLSLILQPPWYDFEYRLRRLRLPPSTPIDDHCTVRTSLAVFVSLKYLEMLPAKSWSRHCAKSLMPRRRVGKWRYSCNFLDIGTRWRWVLSFTPLLLYPRGRSPRYPLDRRLGGPQNQYGHCGVDKNRVLQGIEPGTFCPSP